MQLSDIIKLTEFFPYVVIGVIATAIDWSIFSLSVTWLDLHYQFALVLACCTASATHYTANKFITFKCHSKQFASQLPIYITLMFVSLALSMGIMATFINLLMLNKILARILTTGIMIVPNYLMHKHITFSKKLFAQSQQTG